MTVAAADHAACAEVLRRSGSSFALPIRLLPVAKRRGTTALYAFCRRADDIVDEAGAEAARPALDAFAAAVEEALTGGPVADPVLRALADTVRRFAVPVASIRAVLEGVRMDLVPPVYRTRDALDAYCQRVAGAVGVAAIHVWGFHDRRAPDLALDCGLAFQLTNILRDIPEDLARGRIYLPEEDFAACGCAPDDLRAGRIGPSFDRLARLQIDRARAAFARAAALDGMLTTDGRTVFRAMFGVYRALLRAVERSGRAIFTVRPRPSRAALLCGALATLALGPGRQGRRRRIA